MEDTVRELLTLIGEDPDRQGLQGTPGRVAKMYREFFTGYSPEKEPIITVFDNGSDGVRYDQMIFDSGNFYSFCEHHMIPFFGQYWFAYMPSPHGSILGLSKVARVVDYHCGRLQIQERLTTQIVETLWDALCPPGKQGPLGMGLIMEAEHLCKTMRGAKKKGKMRTICLKGSFYLQPVKEEFLSIVK